MRAGRYAGSHWEHFMSPEGARLVLNQSRFGRGAGQLRHLVTQRSGRVTRGASSLDWRICCRQVSASIDRRPSRPVIPLRGLPATAGSVRRFQADSRAGSARDEKKPAVVMSNTYANLQDFYGSDGTRTRDLRRDRPVVALPGWAGIGGDLWQEQSFSHRGCGDCRGPAGASGDLVRDVRGMLCCLTCKPLDCPGGTVRSEAEPKTRSPSYVRLAGGMFWLTRKRFVGS